MDDRWARERAAEVRIEPDEIVNEFEDAPLDQLAGELKRKADVYDGGPEIAAAVATELRRGAAASIHRWPGPVGA